MERTLLTRSNIEAALGESSAAAIRSITEYQPAGGPGDKVFPPTYEGGAYATEARNIDGATVPCVLLDAVQSQANRMEAALLEEWRSGGISLPVITVNFRSHDLANPFAVTSLEAPHRISDALLRDSLLDGVPFRRSESGRRIDAVDLTNATALFEMCPTALVFGLWDATGPRGGQGAKFQRALVSEFVGWDVRAGVSTHSRIDPAHILRGAGPVYRTTDGWSLDPSEAPDGAKGIRPSEVNHGNITPGESQHGGVTISKAVQTTVLSLPALRRLRFPLGGHVDSQVDLAARTMLATQALLAAALVREQGADLRSRCLLVATAPTAWELLDGSGGVRTFDFPVEQAREAYIESVDVARAVGLPWMEQEMVLEPNPHLVELVRKSQELAADQTDDDEDASS